jgi:hypothetical protein
MKFHPISDIKCQSSIKGGVVINISLKLDKGNNFAWHNSLKVGLVSYNSLK